MRAAMKNTAIAASVSFLIAGSRLVKMSRAVHRNRHASLRRSPAVEAIESLNLQGQGHRRQKQSTQRQQAGVVRFPAAQRSPQGLPHQRVVIAASEDGGESGDRK